MQEGDLSRRRYKLISRLGQGTFGRVFCCWDRFASRFVAVKIVRAVKKYSQSALTEIEFLRRVKVCSDAARFHFHCVELLSSFAFHNHVCLVFSTFGQSVFDLLRLNRFTPCKLSLIRDVARQTLLALDFLHRIVGLIHTDLKPENILFEHLGTFVEDTPPARAYPRNSSSSPSQSEGSGELIEDKKSFPYHSPASANIRLIDFGSAVDHHEHHGALVCTRNYRPPEVILRLTWSSAADLWSLGCVLVEMYSGVTLFQTRHNREHLAMIEKTLGPLPQSLLVERSAINGEQVFRNPFIAKYYSEEPISVSAPPTMPISAKALPKLVVDPDGRSDLVFSSIPLLSDIIDEKTHPQFASLVRGLLALDPLQRLTAEGCLHHPFFTSAETD